MIISTSTDYPINYIQIMGRVCNRFVERVFFLSSRYNTLLDHRPPTLKKFPLYINCYAMKLVTQSARELGPVAECACVCIQHYNEQQYQSNTTLRHVRPQSDTTCRLGILYTLCREENHVSLDKRHDGRKTKGLQEDERSTRWKSAAEPTDVQTLEIKYPG